MDIYWASGKGTRVYDSNSEQGNKFAKAITEELFFETQDQLANESFERLVKLKSKIEISARREMRALMPFVAKNLIGLQSGMSGSLELSLRSFDYNPNDDDFLKLALKGRQVRVRSGYKKPYGGTVLWKSLELATMKKKQPGNKSAFFLNRGTLRAALLRQADKLVSGVGEVQVTLKASGKAQKKTSRNTAFVGSMTIRVAPKLTGAVLPALKTGKWNSYTQNLALERYLGLSKSVLDKLQGPSKKPTGSGYVHNIVHRPLLQPALGFWLLHKIPARIADVILR